MNEAWEPTEVTEAVSEKTVKYTVEQKISGPSEDTAGKYSKNANKKVGQPTFGKVTTTFN